MPEPLTGFLSFEDLAEGQGELALSLEYNPDTKDLSIAAYAPLPNDTQTDDIAAAYLSLCNTNMPLFHNVFLSDPKLSHSDLSKSNLSPSDMIPQTKSEPQLKTPIYTFLDAQPPLAIYTGKKYKPVTLKVRPVETELPSRFRITRNNKGNPIKDMPTLPAQPPSYTSTGCYTDERKEVIDKAHPGDFLLPEEHNLMHHFMCVQNMGFAWCDQERGHFCEDFFPPIKIPTIPHKPWTKCNILILPGIYKDVCQIIKSKMDAGSMNSLTPHIGPDGSVLSKRMINHSE